MWIFSEHGFYSIVVDRYGTDPNVMLVRARCEADLDRFGDLLPSSGWVKEPWYAHDADYHWRALANRGDVAEALVAMMRGLEYTNFKSHVARSLSGHTEGRLHALHAVWLAMAEFGDRFRQAAQRPAKKKARKAKR